MSKKEMFVGRYRRSRMRLVLILAICLGAVIVCTCSVAFGGTNYSDLKSRFKFNFYNADNTCEISAKYGLSGAVEIPTSVIVKEGDGVSLPPETEEMEFTVTTIYGFGGTDITSLTIPEGVQTIGVQAFQDCKKLTGSITIPDSVTSLGWGAFARCTALNGSLKLGKGLSKIDTGTFSGCGFTGTLTIPSNITDIDAYAFQDCSGFTGDLTIPATVKSIGVDAFRGCSGFDGTLHLLCAEAEIKDRIFYGCSGFTGLEIAEGITDITDYEFYGCEGMTGNLTLPKSLTSIGFYSFYGCKGFTGALVIPSNVTIVGAEAFDGCSGFTSLTLPDGLQEIGFSAFKECTGLTGMLELPATLTEVGTEAFLNCGFTGSLTIPEGIVYLNGDSFGCPNITGTLTIPSTVTSIGPAFTNMYKVAKIVNNSEDTFTLENFIPEDDTETYFVKSGTTEQLKRYTYDQDGRKVSTQLGTGTYLRNGINPDVFGTPDFTLPDDVAVIQDEAFAGIKASVVLIPSTCTGIGARTFINSTSLKQIRIPAGCAVGEDAFEGCSSVQIFGTAGSPAEEYCKSHSNCTFVAE